MNDSPDDTRVLILGVALDELCGHTFLRELTKLFKLGFLLDIEFVKLNGPPRLFPCWNEMLIHFNNYNLKTHLSLYTASDEIRSYEYAVKIAR